jgi:hypothetical protein
MSRQEGGNVSRFRRRPSPGLIVGTVALIVALAGTSFALPGRNNVDRNDLRRNSVGAKALKGVVQRTAEVNIDQNKFGEATVICRRKQQVLGGGADWNNEAVDERNEILDSGPTAEGWHARGVNRHNERRTLFVTALCLKK